MMEDPAPVRVDALLRELSFQVGRWSLEGQRHEHSSDQLVVRYDGGGPHPVRAATIAINRKADNPPYMRCDQDAFELPGFALFAKLCMRLVTLTLDSFYGENGSDYLAVKRFVRDEAQR
jgi:hypothetical protein